MHLDESQVQRLLHGELARADAGPAREHVERCAVCRDRLDTARRDEDEVNELLRHLDHPPPRVDAKAMVARARSRRRSWVNKAAAILLMLGLGGVAWAAPWSPLRALLANVARWAGGPPESAVPRTVPRPAPSAEPPPSPGAAGIAVAPGQRLVIRFTSAQADGTARVSLTDGQNVVVRAPAGAAAFTSTDDGLMIDNAGSRATFEIEVPRTAVRVEVRVGSRRVFVKNGARITVEDKARSDGLYIFSLARPGS